MTVEIAYKPEAMLTYEFIIDFEGPMTALLGYERSLLKDQVSGYKGPSSEDSATSPRERGATYSNIVIIVITHIRK